MSAGPPTRVLVALDAFKGTIDQHNACAALARGVAEVAPGLVLDLCPIADGGEGTLAVLRKRGTRQAFRGQAAVRLEDGTVLFESAHAIGLDVVKGGPWSADSAPLAPPVRAAVAAGERRLAIALGGSGTVDGGVGLLAALGAKIRTASGAWTARVHDLGAVTDVDLVPARATLRQATLDAWVDVTVPLGGAGAFFAQKGLTGPAAEAHQAALVRWGDTLSRACGRDVLGVPGAGAAGGLGAAISALGGALLPGAAAVLDRLDFDARLARADLVVTGEGRFDAQSRWQKGPGVVVERAAAAGKPCVVVAGQIDGNLSGAVGFSLVDRCARPTEQPADALATAGRWLAKAVAGGLCASA